MSDLDHARLMLNMAGKDLKALQGMMDVNTFANEIFGFHAQQAVEKALKAWLSLVGVDYPRMHDLEELLAQLESNGETVPERFYALIDLTEAWGSDPLLDRHPDVLSCVVARIASRRRRSRRRREPAAYLWRLGTSGKRVFEIPIRGGGIVGTGTLNGPINVSGTGYIAPGFSPGTLSLNGAFDMSGGLLNMQIGGPNPGDSEQIIFLGGPVNLSGGAINIDFINGYVPDPNLHYNLFQFPGGAGGLLGACSRGAGADMPFAFPIRATNFVGRGGRQWLL